MAWECQQGRSTLLAVVGRSPGRSSAPPACVAGRTGPSRGHGSSSWRWRWWTLRRDRTSVTRSRAQSCVCRPGTPRRLARLCPLWQPRWIVERSGWPSACRNGLAPLVLRTGVGLLVGDERTPR
jgi:hypothetical protein